MNNYSKYVELKEKDPKTGNFALVKFTPINSYDAVYCIGQITNFSNEDEQTTYHVKFYR